MVAPDLSVSQDALLGSRGCHDERSIFAVFGGSIYDFFFLWWTRPSRVRGRALAGRKKNGFKRFGSPSKHKMFSTRRMRKKRRTERKGVMLLEPLAL